jgi:hypothetical protein
MATKVLRKVRRMQARSAKRVTWSMRANGTFVIYKGGKKVWEGK